MLKKFVNDLFGGNSKQALLKKYEKTVAAINALEADITTLTDEELQAKTPYLKEQLKNGKTVKDILPEAFAVTREASKRVLGMRHYDVQLIGGMVLNSGAIAEMRTGEGKTLVATAPAYLNALTGKGVHVVTVNDYLAKRDSEWMGKVYKFLGLSVGLIQSNVRMSADEKRAAYACDITYGTNNEFGFDYLRDNMAHTKEFCVQRDLNFAIIDEVDSILIDEARTPLIISGQINKEVKTYTILAQVADKLIQGVDYTVEEKTKNTILTEAGAINAEKLLNIDDLYAPANLELAHDLINALKAKEFYHLDKDYLNMEGEIVIVDEFTGRLMNGRRYGDGLHQAIEAKERVKIQQETQTLASITFQNYFRLYEKISGMTGTALTEEEEFVKIYGLEVLPIPTNRASARKDHADLIYKTDAAKYNAVVEEIAKRHVSGQPMLVGTASVERSERVSKMLMAKKIPHTVLNAKNHAKEAEIIAQAGRKGAITIATNMAGRGTDIILGGNAEILAKKSLETTQGLTPEMIDKKDWDEIVRKIEAELVPEKEAVLQTGGLCVLGTERHESRRIDNQLRGRAGRQGDVGETRFYVALDDSLMRIFGGDKVAKIMDMMKVDENTPIESKMVSGSIEGAQKKVETHNFGMRQNVLEYDDVMNQQRNIIYAERKKVLEKADLREDVLDMSASVVENIIPLYINPDKAHQDWDLDGLLTNLEQEIPQFERIDIDELDKLNFNDIEPFLLDKAEEYYTELENAIGTEMMRDLERYIVLRSVDTKWIDHLHAMDNLKDGIWLRGYGQKNPLIEYKNEGYQMFMEMMNSIKADVVRFMYHQDPAAFKAAAAQTTITSGTGVSAINVQTNQGEIEGVLSSGGTTGGEEKHEKIGRNDPCPCGSGKKYKKCHGANVA